MMGLAISFIFGVVVTLAVMEIPRRRYEKAVKECQATVDRLRTTIAATSQSLKTKSELDRLIDQLPNE